MTRGIDAPEVAFEAAVFIENTLVIAELQVEADT
jgi:hypothetical protein